MSEVKLEERDKLEELMTIPVGLCVWGSDRVCSGCGYRLPDILPLTTKRNCKAIPQPPPPQIQKPEQLQVQKSPPELPPTEQPKKKPCNCGEKKLPFSFEQHQKLRKQMEDRLRQRRIIL